MKILNLHLVIIVFLLTISSTLSVFAAESSNDDSTLTSSVTIDYIYDDNLLSDQNNIIDANIFIVSPELQLIMNSGSNSYEFILNGEIGKYEGSSEDNYSDSSFSALGYFELNSRNRLGLSASIENNHDDRGVDFSQGNGSNLLEVDEFKQNTLEANYSFGREATVGRIDFSIATQDINYDSRLDINNEDVTRTRDQKSLVSSVAFTYRMTAKTNLLATIQNSDVEYDISSGLDSTEKSFLIGASWQSSAKTTGSVQLGYRDRSVDNGDDNSTSTWQMVITWSPLSYSNLNFRTNKNSEESIGIGSYRTVTSSEVSWNHDWNDRFSSIISLQLSDTDFEGTPFSDSETSLQASVNYQFQEWMSVRLSYTNTDRETNDITLPYNYDREIIGLSLVFSL